MSKTFRNFLLSPLAAFAVHAYGSPPTDLLTASYAVFTTDINQDGCADYLVKAKDLLVVIDLDDLIVPIPVPSFNKPFLLLSEQSCQYTLAQPVSQAQASNAAWVAAPYRLVIGDTKGDGNGSFHLIPTLSTTGPLFNVLRNPDRQTFSLLQVLDTAALSINQASATAQFIDADGDTRTDLVVSRPDGLLDVYIAGADGMFALEGPDNRAAAALLTWQSFMAQLRTGSVEGALKYVNSASQAGVRTAMTQADSNLPAFAAAIKNFVILEEEQPGVVQAAVVFSSAGQDETFVVRFSKEEDGIWRIVSM